MHAKKQKNYQSEEYPFVQTGVNIRNRIIPERYAII